MENESFWLEVAARIVSPVMEDLRLEVMGLAPYRVFTYDDAWLLFKRKTLPLIYNISNLYSSTLDI